jgi:hypothetical protein
MMPIFLPSNMAGPRGVGDLGTCMSQDVMANTRRELKNFYSYSVKFRAWGSFAVDIDKPNTDFTGGQINTLIMRRMIVISFENILSAGDSEHQELILLNNTINQLLAHFQFNFHVYGPPRRDFDFTTLENEVVLSGEGKRSTKLPDTELPQDASHNLCSFGFATHMVDGAEDQLAEVLRLSQPALTRDRRNPRASKASPFVESLLACGEDITQVASFVNDCRTALPTPTVRATDAIDLWAAVMQACFAAVSSSKRVSMVLSVKMVWFIQLKVENGDCYIDITNGRRVDGKGFLMDLVRLLQYSKQDEGLRKDEKDTWDIALEAIARDESSDDEEAQPKKFLGKHARSDSKDGSPPDSSNPSQGGTDAASEPESTNASYRRPTVSIDQSNAFGDIGWAWN